MHDFNAFVTLTFSEEFVPPELRPRDVQLFMKRLRKLSPWPLRFFACGEYGDLTGRPHYHLALFGFPWWRHDLIEQSWMFGRVQSVELNEKSAAYIAGYVAKKYENLSRWVDGRHPEFTRMSNRPGIGARAAEQLASELTKKGAVSAMMESGDVPHEVRIAGQKMPLGRYLRDVIREQIGWEKGVPKEVQLKQAIERSFMTADDLRESARRRRASDVRAAGRLAITRSKRKFR